MTWVVRNIAGGNFLSWKPALDLGINHGFGDRGLTYSSDQKDSFCLNLKDALRVDSIFESKQVHGTAVYDVSEGPKLVEADTLMGDIRSKPNSVIFIKTADCVPLIAIGDKQVSLIHAGWRGLAGGAIQSALGAINNLKMVLIGPAADKCCYEVGQEVLDQIGDKAVCQTRGAELFLSTIETAENIVHSNFPDVEIRVKKICTMCDARYNSYRRDNSNLRNITFATVFSAHKY